MPQNYHRCWTLEGAVCSDPKSRLSYAEVFSQGEGYFGIYERSIPLCCMYLVRSGSHTEPLQRKTGVNNEEWQGIDRNGRT